MSEILLHVTRGNIVENIHRGDIAVVNYKKELVSSVGNPYKKTFMRSCAKPIQALPVIESGAAKSFGINQKELAVICSSHYAEQFHIEAVSSILHKLGLHQDALLCGPTYSIKEEVTQSMCKAGYEKQRIYNNCSGKHAGMLAVSTKEGYDLSTYHQVEHPLQQIMLQTISDVCEVEKENIGIGIDGCGVPVVELPLFNMALSFAKLSHSSVFEENRKNAVDSIVAAMTKFPEMVAGTGGFCTELMRNTNGKLIGKLGADSVYCIGILDYGIGIAVKVEDGNMMVLSSVVIEVLKQLGYLDQQELTDLRKFHLKETINSLNQKVGEIQPVFQMHEKIGCE